MMLFRAVSGTAKPGWIRHRVAAGIASRMRLAEHPTSKPTHPRFPEDFSRCPKCNSLHSDEKFKTHGGCPDCDWKLPKENQ
jgi:hypothetical protein